ncbi:PEP-CTERM sorting domain-containing protein [Aeoliella sp. SH292]|uniref:PEP-CTERM sorting domain-containing protein n=1 Tax=Aeoliella sp. SH292 TaxID=3454464 RepID=UPI003F9D4F39
MIRFFMSASSASRVAVLSCLATTFFGVHAVAATIPINNPSFELAALTLGTGGGAPTGWNRVQQNGGGAGRFYPSPALYTNQDLNQLGYLFVRDQPGLAALWQNVGTIVPGYYDLTAAVGLEAAVPPTVVPFRLNFEAIGGGTTLLGSTSFPVGTFNSSTLTDITASLTIPDTSPHLGKTLRIVLLVQGQDPGGNPNDPRGSYNVDNIRMTHRIPEPATVAMMLVGCAVVVGIVRCQNRR